MVSAAVSESAIRCACEGEGRRARRGGGRAGGFTYLGLLFAVALAGIALAGTGVLWQQESRREKEKELLFIGEQYRHAIGSYFDHSPGPDKQYPERLADLLLDRRFPNPVRHLRRLYRDPMTAEGEWELILQQGRISGVASKAKERPVKIAGFPAEEQDFEGATSYAEWRFISAGNVSGSSASGAAGGAAASLIRQPAAAAGAAGS
jgi:type II secretory pathway pseudopilin PulG